MQTIQCQKMVLTELNSKSSVIPFHVTFAAFLFQVQSHLPHEIGTSGCAKWRNNSICWIKKLTINLLMFGTPFWKLFQYWNIKGWNGLCPLRLQCSPQTLYQLRGCPSCWRGSIATGILRRINLSNVPKSLWIAELCNKTFTGACQNVYRCMSKCLQVQVKTFTGVHQNVYRCVSKHLQVQAKTFTFWVKWKRGIHESKNEETKKYKIKRYYLETNFDNEAKKFASVGSCAAAANNLPASLPNHDSTLALMWLQQACALMPGRSNLKFLVIQKR